MILEDFQGPSGVRHCISQFDSCRQ